MLRCGRWWAWLVVCCGVGIVAHGIEPEHPAPLPPEEAARSMIVPAGFQVSLFAGEPDVRQPIGFCIDDRGRLWVAEAYNYPNHGTQPGDRIVILADTDHDGRFDQRTVFYDQLNYVTGIEVGFGGAWVMSPPFFYFIPDCDRDDRPDAPPQVLLDGFGNHANAHNLANGFAWGPDGWLYGTHGRTNWSRIGRPGTPDDRRQQFDGGVWRYHPVRHVWEPYADGTTNPWGIDWNDYGQAFVCNCVNPHLFQVIQGAHYEPWRNRESSRHAYERIATIADHLHFVGTVNVRDGLGSEQEDTAGGGHAHCGTLVYLGDNWPDQYRNTILMNNIHGRRINNDLPRRSGSGYLAGHGPDLLRSRDPWFMGVTLQLGPDGSVFASDWSDTGECHSVKNTRRQTGRIFKISYGQPRTAAVDVAALSNDDLVELHRHRNDWQVRHARRVLQERAARGDDLSAVHARLRSLFDSDPDVPRKLRVLWTLHATGGLDDQFLMQQLDHADEYVRGWSVQLLCEDFDPPPAAEQRLIELAAGDPSPLVRLYLASAAQRLGLERRWPIVEALAAKVEDAADQNLPLMVWYALEPLVAADSARFVALGANARIPLLRRHAARRVAAFASEPQALAPLIEQLGKSDRDPVRADLLAGLLQGLEGRRSVPMPPAWPTAFAALRTSNDPVVARQAIELALIFDDPRALTELQTLAVNAHAEAAARNRAIQALIGKRPAGFAEVLLKLVPDPAVGEAALRGLAEYDHSGTVEAILEQYPRLSESARQIGVQTLASRREWTARLLDAVAAGRVPRSDLTAYTARQIVSLRDPAITGKLKTLWGDVRITPADRTRQIADLKQQLTPAALAAADLVAGRTLFQANCANCHVLFDAGGAIGPNLTGSQRTNLDYLLENLVDPSAAVSRDFQLHVVETTSGRVVTGLLHDESDAVLVIQTATERLLIPRMEVESHGTSPVSLMPDGLLQRLTAQQVRDLIAYLGSPVQVAVEAR